MLSVWIVICVSFGSIQTVPLTYKDPFTSNNDLINYNNMVRATRNLILNPVAESVLPLSDNTRLEDARLYRDTNEFIRLPTIPPSEFVIMPPETGDFIEDRIKYTLPLDYSLNTNNMEAWRRHYLQTTYDPDFYEADGLNTGSINPYEVDLYPFVHTSLSAALNPVPPVHTLPPVYSTHIHDSMPPLDARGDYDVDVLSPENSELLPPNLRITRSGTEDFLNELRHDAILKNLLPTMHVPYVRGAEGVSYQVPQQQTVPLIAVYPTSASNGCAVPLLLNCSPSVVRGMMSRLYPDSDTRALSGASGNKAYREAGEPDSDNSISEVKMIM